jgi:hypothetical protein
MRVEGVVLILLALGTFVTAHAESPELSTEELRRLEAGEILTWTRPIAGRTVPWVKAVGLVDAPPATVWAIIDECGNYENTMPRTFDSEEVERRGEHVRCRAVGDLPFPLSDVPTETDAVHTVEPEKLYRREWKQRSGDFNANEGHWTLAPWSGGAKTLATYEALTEPKVPLPDFILRWATESVLPDMIAKLREAAAARRPASAP